MPDSFAHRRAENFRLLHPAVGDSFLNSYHRLNCRMIVIEQTRWCAIAIGSISVRSSLMRAAYNETGASACEDLLYSSNALGISASSC